MTYWQILRINMQKELVDSLESLLLAKGALSITLSDAKDDEILEPMPGEHPLWDQTIVTATFDATTPIDRLSHEIKLMLPDSIKISTQRLQDENWLEKWEQNLKPFVIADTLTITPSHHQSADRKTPLTMVLDPGLAFGSGQHPTTQLCLEWLIKNLKKKQTVIDFGCGSGILSIASLMLGAQHCDAIDIDPQALTASQNNAEQNHVAEKMTTHLATQQPNVQGDIVVANIISSILIQNRTNLTALLKPKATLVLCGILTEQAHAIQAAFNYKEAIEIKTLGEWCLIAIKASNRKSVL